jgi:hypothetical protein
MPKITQKYLKEVLHYDPETNRFTWVSPPGRRLKPGATAGCAGTGGPWQIKIDGVVYPAHKLARLYLHGIWSDAETSPFLPRDRTPLAHQLAILRAALPATPPVDLPGRTALLHQQNAIDRLELRLQLQNDRAEARERCQREIRGLDYDYREAVKNLTQFRRLAEEELNKLAWTALNP